MNNKTKVVLPCGKLYSQGQTYFLLSPVPVMKDSWQDNGTYCFVAVPVAVNVWMGEVPVYLCARHVVTNSFVYEIIPEMDAIKIIVDDEYDLAEFFPAPEPKNMPEPLPF